MYGKSWIRRFGKAWSLVGLSLLLLCALEAASWLVFLAKDLLDGGPEWKRREAARAQADGYEGAPWTEDYFRDFEASSRTAWRSYVYWRRLPFDSPYIHVGQDGLRATWNPPPEALPAGARPLRVFVFGGSAVWGTGARDDRTLPSCLSRCLNERGIPAHVTNFGESGHVSTQEVIALMLELQRGDPPDLVIFQDGVNDTFSALQNNAAGLPQNEANRRKEFNASKGGRSLAVCVKEWMKRSHLWRLGRAVMSRLMPSPADGVAGGAGSAAAPDDALARDVVNRYRENMRIVNALARQWNFKVLFFWQPSVFFKDELTAYEAYALGEEAAYRDFFHKVRDNIQAMNLEAEEPAFHDLSAFFKEDASGVFIDWCHLVEDGNRRVAEAIAAFL